VRPAALPGAALLGAALAGLALLAGCVAPAPTTSAYQGKAARTAQDALSQVETARLAVDTGLRGRLPQAYLETLLSQAEDAFGSIQTTFDSVQPPADPAADDLRDALDELLSAGADALGQARIAARRQRSGELAEAARSLAPVAVGLERFEEEHPG
jgi:hypothetical protein